MENRDIVISVKEMNKTFVLTKAVIDMHMDVARGEIRGLIGENGSGKSTLTSMIAGSLKPDNGEMMFMGKPYTPKSSIEGQNAGIAMMVQEAGTISGLTVAENIFLGNHREVSTAGFINKRMMQEKAREVLKLIGAEEVRPECLIDEYSFEDRKMIEIAKALHGNPEVLILDETTTALSLRGREIIYGIIADMKKAGKAVIFISHDLDELKSVCDSVTIMRDGEYVKTIYGEEIQIDTMRQLMVGRELSNHYYRADSDVIFQDEVVLEADKINLGATLNDVSFQLHRGEILGIGGLTECGMHELCKVVFGLVKADSGEVRVWADKKKIQHAYDAAKFGMGYIPKDREKEGLMGTSSICDNVVLMSYDKLKKGPFISRKGERGLVNEQVKKLHIKMASIHQNVTYLSGGNKQKVAIGKWTANGAEIILMDCPTRGIDIGAKAAIYALMEDFKREGRAIIMISEELTELIGMADRVLIMKDGRIASEFRRDEGLVEQTLIRSMI